MLESVAAQTKDVRTGIITVRWTRESWTTFIAKRATCSLLTKRYPRVLTLWHLLPSNSKQHGVPVTGRKPWFKVVLNGNLIQEQPLRLSI
jgi:hypothetical protein